MLGRDRTRKDHRRRSGDQAVANGNHLKNQKAIMASVVLIVEDEPHIAEMVAMKLQQGGLQTAVAHDGAEALLLLARMTFSLVVADVNLPGISGVELARRMAADEQWRRVPVILVTGFGLGLEPIASDCPSVCAVLAKPFSPRDLLQRALSVISSPPSLSGGLGGGPGGASIAA